MFKHELFWMIPVCALVALFSVIGLGYKPAQKQTSELIIITEIEGYDSPNRMDQTYCRSKVVTYNQDLPSENTSEMVVYDAFYSIGGMVSPDTECAPASETFLNRAYQLGFRWQTSGGLIMDRKDYP
jgi:hypothetical protein